MRAGILGMDKSLSILNILTLPSPGPGGLCPLPELREGGQS